MRRLSAVFTGLGVCFALATAHAAPLTPNEKQADFDQVLSILRSSYGPLQYKNEMQGISLGQLEKTYRKRIENTTTNGEFYYEIVRFVAELRDSHSSVSVPTDHAAQLGFSTDMIEGKVLIERVNRNLLPKAVFPFDRGDEIVTLGDRKAADVIKDIAPFIGAGYEKARLRRAGMAFAQRAGSRMPVPTGPVIVRIRSRAKPEKTVAVALNWLEKGTALDEFDAPPEETYSLKDSEESLPFSVSIKEADAELLPFNIEESYRCSGKTRVKIPADAVMVMEHPFVAYYHPTPKGNVGYLRIPHYIPFSSEDEDLPMLPNYVRAMEKLRAETVGLIIDQDHNCGGQVNLVEDMVSLFMNHPFERLGFRLRSSKSEYLRYQNIPHLAALLKNSWMQGDFLTPLVTLSSRSQHAAFKTPYEKPVIVLIDEMAGSGGDAFPAMMQGFGRAKLVGTRTVGAGGHVEEVNLVSSYSALKMRVTRSLFFRPDGTPVENNGASPDYQYTPTVADFTGGYQDYQKFYLEKLAAMLP